MQHCDKCGGDGAHCTACETPGMLCECFQAESRIDCDACDGSGLIKGGQGRTAENLQLEAENLIALMILGALVIICALVVASTNSHF